MSQKVEWVFTFPDGPVCSECGQIPTAPLAIGFTAGDTGWTCYACYTEENPA